MNDNPPPMLVDKAVIDVGSNSVRLVIFRTFDTFFQPVFNENVTASLGRAVRQTGHLNPHGVALALTAIQRFMRILNARNITKIYAVATAAVREASDGDQFLAQIEETTGLSVQKLSGEQEARLSALGVIAGEPAANGMMADLGGSSLELVELTKAGPGVGASLTLGPLAIGIEKDYDLVSVQKQIDKTLSQADVIDDAKTLYVVGGAWRSLALVHMKLRGYPLRILHNYRMSRKEALTLTRLVEQQSPASLAKVPGVSQKRANTLPYAALLLRNLLDRTKVEQVMISAFGLREGLLLDDLSPDAAFRHPVLASVEALAHQNWSSSLFGHAVENWLSPVFDSLDPVFGKTRTKLLQTAICQLADIGARMHPDHRAEIAFDIVLYAPFAGLSHRQRVALALAIFHRYAGPKTPPRVPLIMRIVGEDVRAWAMTVGFGLRCASAVSGRTASLLERTLLTVNAQTVMLDAQQEESILLTSSPRKRLRDLADSMGLQAQLLD